MEFGGIGINSELQHHNGLSVKISQDLVKNIRAAQHFTVLTGAGISAESGIPTFREAQTGLWATYNPEELATPQAFKNNPLLVLNWYKWRRKIVSQANPNPGHFALAKMESIAAIKGFQFLLITQNIDGLHQRAGSRKVVELHGNIKRIKCSRCDRYPEIESQNDRETLRCKYCEGFLRPDVVWFGENIPKNTLQTAWQVTKKCDIFFAIGTSAIVQPAAQLPIIALQNGAIVVEINPNETPFTRYATFHFQGPSGIELPNLIDTAWPEFE
jgi:NAD-dependent deacetylase